MFTLSIKVCNTELNKNDLHMKTRILIMSLLVLLTGSTAFCQVSNNGTAQKTSNTAQKGVNDNKVYDIKELKDTLGFEPPHLYGGHQALMEFLCNNIKYPVVAMENNVQGKVIVSLIVDESGYMRNVKVEKSVDPSLDLEARRVVRMLPRWIPGKQDGVPIKTKITVPVVFRLTEAKKK